MSPRPIDFTVTLVYKPLPLYLSVVANQLIGQNYQTITENDYNHVENVRKRGDQSVMWTLFFTHSANMTVKSLNIH